MDRQTITMIAEVIDVYPDGLMVMDKQNGQTVQVHAQDIECFSPGEWVCILYNGQMTHSIPPQITALSIESLHDAPPMPAGAPLTYEPSVPAAAAPTRNQEIYTNSTQRWDAVSPRTSETPVSPLASNITQPSANNNAAPLAESNSLTQPIPAPESVPYPNPDLILAPSEEYEEPPFEVRGVIVQKGPDFFIIRNRQYGLLRINYEYAHHFCVRQRVLVKYYISTLSQPPQIPAIDVIPICGT